jgi:hypothetical protein
LELVVEPGLPAGTRFRILRNQGNPSAPVAGNFAGFPGGQPFVVAGRTWYLDYSAGSGGDIDLVLASPRELWRLQHFGTILNAGAAADAADPFGRGVPNLLVYALGLDPALPLVAPASTAHVSQDRLHLTFFRARAELTYVVEASSDLIQWSAIATNPGEPGQTVTVSDVVDGLTADPPRRFLRLRVESP